MCLSACVLCCCSTMNEAAGVYLLKKVKDRIKSK